MKRFIIIDGLDGSGKDTQAALIKQKYLDKGESVILRSHPSNDNSYGIKAKNALLGKGKFNKFKASIYYALDVIRSVRLYYKKADTVIFVRYLIGVAYLPFPLAKLLYEIFYIILPTSRYMFFLDVNPEEALKRLQLRDDNEMFENIHDLIKVRKKALELVQEWYIIDTGDSIQNIQREIDYTLEIIDKN